MTPAADSTVSQQQLQVPRWQLVQLNDRALGAHLAAWNALWRTLPLPHPMLQGQFIEALLRHFGTGQEWLCILDGPVQPRGMCIVLRASPAEWRAFMPAPTRVSAVLLSDLDEVEALLTSLPGKALALDMQGIDPHVTPADLSHQRGLEVLPRD